MTCGFCFTSVGVPSAIFSPKSRTMTRSEISITTPMSCSMSTIVVPHSSFTSRMKRAMSSFSSTFMPQQNVGMRHQSASQLDAFLQTVRQRPHRALAQRLNLKEFDYFLHDLALRHFLPQGWPKAYHGGQHARTHMNVTAKHEVIEH